MSVTGKNTISADEAAAAVTWSLPQIGARGNHIPTAEKEAKEKERLAAERAKESVEDIVPLALPTAEEIAAVFEAARKDGYAEGFTEGRTAGLTEGLDAGSLKGEQQARAQHSLALETLIERLESLIADLSGPSESQQQQIAQTLVSVVQQLVRKLVYTELSIPSPHIENLVSACVALLPVTEPTRIPQIKVHPDDLAYLRGEAQIENLLSRCEWIPDPALAMGGCIVTAGSSLIDASTDARLRSVLEAFEQGKFAAEIADQPSATIDKLGAGLSPALSDNPTASPGDSSGDSSINSAAENPTQPVTHPPESHDFSATEAPFSGELPDPLTASDQPRSGNTASVNQDDGPSQEDGNVG